MSLFEQKHAFWFHYKICSSCHLIPNATQWFTNDEAKDLQVFTAVKRQGAFNHWEPFYIGTNSIPHFDERLNWEGKSDKMTQAYIMCILDYSFNVLSNAFLIHKPGVKEFKKASRPAFERINNELIDKHILPEIKMFYGERRECRI